MKHFPRWFPSQRVVNIKHEATKNIIHTIACDTFTLFQIFIDIEEVFVSTQQYHIRTLFRHFKYCAYWMIIQLCFHWWCISLYMVYCIFFLIIVVKKCPCYVIDNITEFVYNVLIWSFISKRSHLIKTIVGVTYLYKKKTQLIYSIHIVLRHIIENQYHIMMKVHHIKKLDK